MPSGFKIMPEGTDLDELFYSNESGAGELGFKSGNKDLGNIYAPGSIDRLTNFYSKLEQSDIGYCRGNMIQPVIYDSAITGHILLNYVYGSCNYYTCAGGAGENDANYQTTTYCYSRPMYGYIDVQASGNGGSGDLYWEVEACYVHKGEGRTYKGVQGFKADYQGLTNCGSLCYGPMGENSSSIAVGADVETTHVLLHNALYTEGESFSFSYAIEVNDGRCDHKSFGNYIRVYQRFTNARGSSEWVYDDFCIGDGDTHDVNYNSSTPRVSGWEYNKDEAYYIISC